MLQSVRLDTIHKKKSRVNGGNRGCICRCAAGAVFSKQDLPQLVEIGMDALAFHRDETKLLRNVALLENALAHIHE